MYVCMYLNCRFYSLGSGFDMFFSWNCAVRVWRAKYLLNFNNTNSELTC